MRIRPLKKTRRLASIASALLVVATLTLPLWSHAQPSAESDDFVDVVIERGNHSTITFWVNRFWTSSDILGRASLPGPPSQAAPPLATVPIRLVRYDQTSAETEQVDRKLDLAAFEARLNDSSYRVLGESQAVTDTEGQFAFRNLEAGYYSVQIDWSAVPEGVPFIIAKLKYPHRTDLATPAFSAFTWPGSAQAADDVRPDSQ